MLADGLLFLKGRKNKLKRDLKLIHQKTTCRLKVAGLLRTRIVMPAFNNRIGQFRCPAFSQYACSYVQSNTCQCQPYGSP